MVDEKEIHEQCSKHAMIEDNLRDAKGKVSMRIFGISISIITLIFGALFAIYSKTSDAIVVIDKNSALGQQTQERIVGTLDGIAKSQTRLERKLERHRDKASVHVGMGDHQ